MATLVLNAMPGSTTGIDMVQLFDVEPTWSVLVNLPGLISTGNGIRQDYFYGTNLHVDGSGNATGTITGWSATDATTGMVYAVLSGVQFEAAAMFAAIDGNTEAALLAKLFAGADTITGSAGADIIDGYAGIDTMAGGRGNDTYRVDNSADVVVEASDGGIDLVRSTASAYTLPGNVENGLIATTFIASMTGNKLDNLLTAGNGDNVIDGVSGDDTVSYSAAASGVTVNLGLTTGQFTAGSGIDTLRNIDHLTGSRFNDTLTGNAGSNRIDGAAGTDRMSGGDGNDTYVVDNIGDVVVETNAGSAGGVDLVLSNVGFFALGSNVENGRIVASFGASMTGNGLDNVLAAGAGINQIDGAGGTDTVDYAYAGAAVVVNLGINGPQNTGGSGSDFLIAIENLKGSSFNDTLTGNAGTNRLDGGLGADRMTGGDGWDTYVVDNTGDVVTESNAASAGGVDVVISSLANYTLGANVEVGRIGTAGSANLTGNGLNNTLVAGAGNNLLNGAGGIDKADYSAATAAVTVNLGVTTAQATGGSGSDTLTAIEDLLGSGYSDTLTGSSGANVLTGGAGSDRITGGGGADRFVLSSVSGSDTITDFLSGTDKLAVHPSAILIGDFDATLEGATTRNAPGGFAATAELVVFTANIAGSITTSTAAATIGAATTAYATGARALFAVDNGNSSALYLFTSSGADAVVSAAELTLLATLSTTAATTTADYLFGF